MAAIKRYNNVQLDGKPMKIELVGTNMSTPAAGLPSAGGFGDFDAPPRRYVFLARLMVQHVFLLHF